MSSPRTKIFAGRPTQVEYASFATTVRRIDRIGANFVRVTLAGDELANFHAAGFDQRVKLIFPLEDSGVSTFPRGGADWYTAWRDLPVHERCPMRTYTVRESRAELNEIDIDFVVHGDIGPATRWVNRASVGDELIAVGPDARTLVNGDGPVGGVEFRPSAAKHILLAGDETAAPAICSIVESLPADTSGQVFIEVAVDGDILSVDAPERVTVTWLSRERRPGARHGDTLDTAVRAWVSEMITPSEPRASDAFVDVDVDRDILWDVPGEPDAAFEHDLYAWIAGEAACIKAMRRFLVGDAGMHRDDVAFMGYWRSGKSEN